MSETESNHARWLKWIGAAVGILAIFGIIGASLESRLIFLAAKIDAVGERVEQISDPQTGYPQAVRQGIADALTQAVDKDMIVRAELARAIGDALADALQENRDDLDRMRTEIVAELRNQTGQLSGDIKRLGTDLNDVRARRHLQIVDRRRHWFSCGASEPLPRRNQVRKDRRSACGESPVPTGSILSQR